MGHLCDATSLTPGSGNPRSFLRRWRPGFPAPVGQRIRARLFPVLSLFHVPADGFRPMSSSQAASCDPTRVPDAGHARSLPSERTIGLLPALVLLLGVELSCFAPDPARTVGSLLVFLRLSATGVCVCRPSCTLPRRSEGLPAGAARWNLPPAPARPRSAASTCGGDSRPAPGRFPPPVSLCASKPLH